MLLGRVVRHFALAVVLALSLVGNAEGAFDPSYRPKSCYEGMVLLQLARFRDSKRPIHVVPFGSDMPIARALEKEGLLYSDIAAWFDRVRKEDKTEDKELFPGVTRMFAERLEQELRGQRAGALLRWLRDYTNYYRAAGVGMPPSKWTAMDPRSQIEWILARDNPFDVINIRGREALIYDGILDFNVLLPSAEAPAFLTVGDDQGSYEVRHDGGESDRREFHRQQAVVEEFLDGLIGHQHIVHEWPADPAVRAAMAPQYIELLDAASWFLFWRQMYRPLGEAESILTHPFLGVYTNSSLDRLHRAVVAGDPKKFNNKFRMVGARRVKANPELPGQEGRDRLPDWELRSGNKGVKREFMEDLIEARFWSGDYSGMRDFRTYRDKFDPSAPIARVCGPFVTPQELEILTQFEAAFPLLRWSSHPLAHNHVRNKVLSPLYDWGARLDIAYKAETLARAQQRYASGLVKIAKHYLKRSEKVRGPPDKASLREDTVEALEYNIYLFAHRVWLDEDFERYLMPRFPGPFPSMQVTPTGKIDVNQIDAGIEWSFRFPDPPRGREAADREIRKSAEALQKAFEAHLPAGAPRGKLEKLTEGGHGHGLSIRYQYTAPDGEVWRIEWDGVARTYVDGEARRTRAGHIEVPSPKKAMQDEKDIVRLYRAMRELGRVPRRGAGGAHYNMDLAPLFELPAKQGARKAANLIALFESHREMFQFLWQHPFRLRAAMPVDRTPSLIQRLDAFDGEWDDLGRLLYEERYFNPFITRKPAYAQLNATAVMGNVVPEVYQQPIDIKNPEVQWFPAFGGKGKDRIEFRLFDAPPEEYIAVLQIKYMRAFLDKALNARGRVKLSPVYAPDAIQKWKEDPGQFIRDAEAHYRWLGLDPKEFAPLTADALRIQFAEPTLKPPPERFSEFLPPE